MKPVFFKDNVVIITGASSGIGKALALQLSKQGARVSLASRNAERLNDVAEECSMLGGKAIPVPTDVSNQEQCQRLIEETVRQYGRIDMLVNNAGYSLVGKFEEIENIELFHRVMDVNFNGVVHCTYFALPYLIKTGGRIVNVSSLGGKIPIPGNTSYVASKFAVAGFSDSLRMELKYNNVSVTAIYPFWVVTEFHENMLDKNGVERGPEGRAIYTEKMMTADQCAKIIIKAAINRKREVVMSPGLIASFIRVIAPNLLDKIIVERFFKPMVSRLQKAEKNTGG